MLRQVEMSIPVAISLKTVDKNKEVLASFIVNCLLKQLSNLKASEHGYVLAVTKLIIGRGDSTLSSEDIIFPVDCCCRTFTPVDGEIMIGVVYFVYQRGVFLKSGPMKMVFLPIPFMPNYNYVPGRNSAFVREDSSKIEIGVVVRYMVHAVRWQHERFMVLACITADGLGPISLNGLDGMDL